MMSTAPALHVQDLVKSFDDVHVLRGVDFDVDRGSIFALLGSNGAGKTTVVRILSTLLTPDAGTARVNGFDVRTQPADVRASIGLTGQFAAVDEILTGRENLMLMAGLRHLTGAGRIAEDQLARFGLTDAGDRRVATYSGGMRRRLDIAMSLIGEPSVIFLDEPTTGLDPQSRLEVWSTVTQLAGAGYDGAPDHPVPRRGRTPPTGSRSSTRSGSSRTELWPNSSSSSRLRLSSTSRSSRPSRTSSSRSSVRAARRKLRRPTWPRTSWVTPPC